jgi:hypothetical protein
MKTKINQIVTALMELESKGYFHVSFDYEKSKFQLRIFKGKLALDKYPIYHKSLNLDIEESGLNEAFNMVETLKNLNLKSTKNIKITMFQCHKRELKNGEVSSEWHKIMPIIEYGDNATSEMLIDGSGYYITDKENDVLYFVDMKQLSETDK